MNSVVQQPASVETTRSSTPTLSVVSSSPTSIEPPSGHSVTATLNFSADGPAKSNPVWVAPKQTLEAPQKDNTITELKFANLAEAVVFLLPAHDDNCPTGMSAVDVANEIAYPRKANKTLISKVSIVLGSLHNARKTVRNDIIPYRYRRASGEQYVYKKSPLGAPPKPYSIMAHRPPLGKTVEYLQSHTEQVIASAAASAQELLPFGSVEPRKVDPQAWREALTPCLNAIDAGPVASKRAPKDESRTAKAMAESMTRNFVVELLKSGTIHRRDLRALHEQLKEIFE